MDKKNPKKTPKKSAKNDPYHVSITCQKNNSSICEHKSKWIKMDNKTIKKREPKYFCTACGFKTENFRDLKRHKNTKKHIKKTQLGSMVSDPKVFQCLCGKTYKYQSGLSKHKKKCKFLKMEAEKKMEEKMEENLEENLKIFSKKEEIKLSETDENVDKSILKELLEQNKTLIDKLTSMANEPKIVNYQNCNNKKMTVNVYLNEKCKDAMNLSDFIQKLQITLDDLYYTKQNGFAKGISNIFVKHLADLNPTERPIHCSDKKRLQFYVKEENKWEKDQENTKLEKTIHDVSIKQIQQVSEWEKVNPNFEEDERLLSEWQETVSAVMGGTDDKIRKKRKELILKTLGMNTELKEDGLVITDKDNTN